MSIQTPTPYRAAPNPLHGELIYEYTARFTQVTDYGVALADVMSGTLPPPAEGVRCDVTFEGAVAGPKLRGTVRGTDYGHLRADGRAGLHIHGTITTDDGKNISLAADGVASIDPESRPASYARISPSLPPSPATPGLTRSRSGQPGRLSSRTARSTSPPTLSSERVRTPHASDGRPCPGFPGPRITTARNFIPKQIPSKCRNQWRPQKRQADGA